MTTLYFDRFDIISRIGDGAFGRVYKVRDINTNEVSALKVYRRKANEFFKSEMNIFNTIGKDLANINFCLGHIDTFNADNLFAIQLSIFPTDLHDLINKPYTFNLNEVRHIGYQLCKALEYLHSFNIIHNDLKPENILLCDQTVSMTTKRLRRTDIRLTDYGHSIEKNGNFDFQPTRQYASPEIIMGSARWSCSSDIWSIGCLLTELYFGEILFDLSERKTSIKRSVEHLQMIRYFLGRFPISLKVSYIGTKKTNDCFLPLKNYITNHDTTDEKQKLFNVIKRMLVICPGHRITAANASKMPFFERHANANGRYIMPKCYDPPEQTIKLKRCNDIDSVYEPSVVPYKYISTIKSKTTITACIGKTTRLMILTNLYKNWNLVRISELIQDHQVDAIVYIGEIVPHTVDERDIVDNCVKYAQYIRDVGKLKPTFVLPGIRDYWIESTTCCDLKQLFAPSKYIENECFSFNGINFYGTPMSPTNFTDKFCIPTRYNANYLNPYGNLPKNVEIIIANDGPLGMQSYNNTQYGDVHLRNLITSPENGIKAVIYKCSQSTSGYRFFNSVVCLNATQEEYSPYILNIRT